MQEKTMQKQCKSITRIIRNGNTIQIGFKEWQYNTNRVQGMTIQYTKIIQTDNRLSAICRSMAELKKAVVEDDWVPLNNVLHIIVVINIYCYKQNF